MHTKDTRRLSCGHHKVMYAKVLVFRLTIGSEACAQQIEKFSRVGQIETVNQNAVIVQNGSYMAESTRVTKTLATIPSE